MESETPVSTSTKHLLKLTHKKPPAIAANDTACDPLCVRLSQLCSRWYENLLHCMRLFPMFSLLSSYFQWSGTSLILRHGSRLLFSLETYSFLYANFLEWQISKTWDKIWASYPVWVWGALELYTGIVSSDFNSP
jgi:hypothetical protein